MDFTIEPRNFRADVEKRCLNLENINRMGRLVIKIWVKRSESIRNRLQKDMRRRWTLWAHFSTMNWRITNRLLSGLKRRPNEVLQGHSAIWDYAMNLVMAWTKIEILLFNFIRKVPKKVTQKEYLILRWCFLQMRLVLWTRINTLYLNNGSALWC